MPSVVEILRALDRSNCRECGLPTCMAFAAQVSKGARRLEDCPRLDPAKAPALRGPAPAPGPSSDEGQLRRVAELKLRLPAIDFEEAAARLGGTASRDRLEVPMLGRVFELDREGDLYSSCHVHLWVHAPLLEYVCGAKGTEPTGDWVHFAELPGTADWHRYFAHRGEDELKAMADQHPALVADVMRIFDAKPPEGRMARRAPRADWSLLLRPLPKTPMLVCYWNREGEFDSKLSLLFDRTIVDNVPVESIWMLTRGIVEMCRRTVRRHTHVQP